ncbi:MAG TPA: hypothetical protein VF747_09480 [Blastocatellia bacterium]|jgi:hypothetical protein
MKRLLIRTALAVTLALSLVSPAALAEHSPAHKAAIRVCKQRYRAAVRGLKRLRSRDRHLRIEQARAERRECIKLAPQ